MAQTISDMKKQILNKNRLEALTDGVFAFALTVLVLNIEVPAELPIPLPTYPVQALLLHLIPDFMQYFMAFIVLAGLWFTHHFFFDRLKYVDRTMAWLNILGLLFVALVPFSAQLSDTYINYPLSSIIFELNALIVGLAFLYQWRYANRNPHLQESGLEENGRKVMENRMIIVPAVSLLGMLLAIIGYSWSTAVFLLIPVLYMTSGRR